MNFLLYTQYVYYIIYNNQTNKTYHGVLDIKSNEIIFNTDEDINTMLAITNNTAYRICLQNDSDCNSKERCQNENCLTCDEQSNSINLCTSCDENKGYVKVGYNDNSFYNCVKNDDPVLERFYYNETLNAYKPCYKLCKSCIKDGNESYHNCLECSDGYMLKPGNNSYNICVNYSKYYYIHKNDYHPFNIYKCPMKSKFYIIDKNSCIDNCSYDAEYKYTFNSKCIKECPQDTSVDNNYCKINSDKCYLNDSYFDYNIIINEDLNLIVNSYLDEFYYTNNFIGIYEYNNGDILILFENISCLYELNINIDINNLIKCYNKNKNNILFSAYKNNETKEYQLKLFNISSKGQINIDDICEETTELYFSETISYFK